METMARDDGDSSCDGEILSDNGYFIDDTNYDNHGDDDDDKREHEETMRVNAVWDDIWNETKAHGHGISHWEDVASDSLLPPVRQRPKQSEFKSHRFEKRNGRWWIIDLNSIGKEKEILTRSEVCPVLTKFYNEAGRRCGTDQVWIRLSERYTGIQKQEWIRLVSEMPVTALPPRYQKPKPTGPRRVGQLSRRVDPITRANPNPSWVAASGLDLSAQPTVSVYGPQLQSSPSDSVHDDDDDDDDDDDEEDTIMHDSQSEGSPAGSVDDYDPDVYMDNYQSPTSHAGYTHGHNGHLMDQMILSSIPWLTLSTDQLLNGLGQFVINGNQLNANDAAILREQKVTALMIAQKPPELVELVDEMELETAVLLQKLSEAIEAMKSIE